MADQEFEKKVRDRLSDYQEQPDDDLWGAINAESSLKPRKKVKKWHITVAASLALLLAVAVTYYVTEFNEFAKSDEQAGVETESVVSKGEPNQTQLAEREESGNQQKHLSNQIEEESSQTENNESSISKPEVIERSSEISGSENNHKSIAEQQGETLLNERREEAVILKPTKVNALSLAWDYPYSIPQGNFSSDLETTSETQAPVKEEVEKKRKSDKSDSRIKLYFLAMPTFSYNRVKANNNDDLLVTAIEKIPAFSLDRFGFRVESGITYQMTPRLSGFAGLVYFNRKQTFEYTVKNVTGTETKYVNGDEAIIGPSSFEEETREYNNDLSNLGVQLGLLYKVTSNKFLHTLGTGVETHYALSKNDIPEEFEKPDLYLFYNLFYRLEYPRESRLKALLQPTFNYSFGLTEKLNTPFYVKPYGFGLNFGVTYKF